MKLTFIGAHAKVGPLCKTFGLDGGKDRTYPLAKRVSSYTEEVNSEGQQTLLDYRDALVKHAELGRALYKGSFKEELINASRKNQTDREEPTSVVILDIDGLPITGATSSACTSATVRTVAEDIVRFLPAQLQDVSYVACASSSFGLHAGAVSLHLHFLLNRPISPAQLKRWLTSLNFTQDEIYKQLDLNPSRIGIKYIVDPCLADNSRIIYIAPPQFGPLSRNPFANNAERVVAVQKGKDRLDTTLLLTQLSVDQNRIDELRNEKIKQLNKKYGLTAKSSATKRQIIDGMEVSVAMNPGELPMEFSYDDEEYARYNIPPSMSNAYWVRKDNPEFVFSFHQGEPPFLFRAAAPDLYRWHIENFGAGHVALEVEGERRKVNLHMFIDRNSDKYCTAIHDVERNQMLELVTQQQNTAEQFMRYHGQIVPDPVPSYYVVMNPNDNRAIYTDGDKTIVNRFVPTQYMLDETPHWLVDQRGASLCSYGDAWLVSLDCPLISNVILHLLGDDLECYEHFVNWLAFIFQQKDKAKTGWMAHGTEGTGKGLFYKNIIRPLFSERHAKQNTVTRIAEDQFNEWIENCIFLMVDEFNMNSGGSLQRTANTLKNYVTEETFMMRAMQRGQEERKQRLNMFLATNDYDAMAAEDKRRYNIAPRQERMLEERLPMVILQEELFDQTIAEELTMFARFLNTFKVDRTKVRKVLSNEAKAAAILAGMSAPARFFRDLETGNFESFAEYLDIYEDPNLSDAEFKMLKRVKGAILSWLPYVNAGETCNIRQDDLRLVYSYLADKSISRNAFGRMLTTNGKVETAKTRKTADLPAGQSLSAPIRAVTVRWIMDDLPTLHRLTNAHLRTTVQPVRTPQENIQREHSESLEKEW